MSAVPRFDADRTSLVAGLAAAAAVTWILSAFYRPSPRYAWIAFSALYIVLAVAANGIAVLAAGAMLRRRTIGVFWKSSATAAWFAPLAVHLQAGSPWSVPIAAAAAVRGAVLLRHSQLPAGGESECNAPRPAPFGLFASLPPRPLARQVSLFFAAVFAQTVLAGGAAASWELSAVSAAISGAILAWHLAGRSSFQAISNPRGVLSSLLTLVFALFLTSGAGGGFGFGVGWGGGSVDSEKGKVEAIQKGKGGGFGGIILLAPRESSPVPLQTPPGPDTLIGKGLRIPLRIPFDGLYWVFKPPDPEPPFGAPVLSGRPNEKGFRSTDSTPLIMEAHQRLAWRVDLQCCRKVEVTVQNADRHPGTVRLELVLIDSSRSRPAELSTGVAPVLTSPLEAFGKTVEVTEALTYLLPETRSIDGFNEVKLRFRLDASRETLAPRIAIEQLLMIP